MRGRQSQQRQDINVNVNVIHFLCLSTHAHTLTLRQSEPGVMHFEYLWKTLSPLVTWLDRYAIQTDKQIYVCMYKQLTSPLQAGCRYSSLYVSPYRLCWFRPQLLENRMQIIIQHDPQTHMYAKLYPVLARVLSVNMNLLTYTKTTSLCFCWAPASWLLSSFHIIPNNYATVQYTFVCSHCRWNWYDNVFLLKHPLQSKPSSVHPTLRFGLFSTIKNCVCNAKTRVFQTVR